MVQAGKDTSRIEMQCLHLAAAFLMVSWFGASGAHGAQGLLLACCGGTVQVEALEGRVLALRRRAEASNTAAEVLRSKRQQLQEESLQGGQGEADAREELRLSHCQATMELTQAEADLCDRQARVCACVCARACALAHCIGHFRQACAGVTWCWVHAPCSCR